MQLSKLHCSIYLINRNIDNSGERAAIDSASGCVKLVGRSTRRAIVHTCIHTSHHAANAYNTSLEHRKGQLVDIVECIHYTYEHFPCDVTVFKHSTSINRVLHQGFSRPESPSSIAPQHGRLQRKTAVLRPRTRSAPKQASVKLQGLSHPSVRGVAFSSNHAVSERRSREKYGVPGWALCQKPQPTPDSAWEIESKKSWHFQTYGSHLFRLQGTTLNQTRALLSKEIRFGSGSA